MDSWSKIQVALGVDRKEDSEKTAYLVQTKVNNQNVPLGVVIDFEIDN